MSMEDVAREGRGLVAGLQEASDDLTAQKNDTLAVLDTTLATAYGASDIAFAYTADRVACIRGRAAEVLAGGGEEAQAVMSMINAASDQTSQLPGLQESARHAIEVAREAIFRLGATTLQAAGSTDMGAKALEAYISRRAS